MENYTISDIGKERSLNEDSTAKYLNNNFSLFVVCDGMGGHKAGDVASKLTVNKVQSYIVANKNENDFSKLLKNAIEYANLEVFEMAKSDEKYSDMGTTIVAALISKDKLYVANVGDSRLYISRDKLYQITKDHSLVSDLVEQGILTEEEAKDYPRKNTINRAIGTQPDVEVDIFTHDLKEGDTILLCTDGLTNMVSDEVIKEVIDAGVTSKDICENLVYIANENGGYDNITVTIYIHRSQE